MANWAALQETLIAKPVVKRAKHGIHFKNGNQIVANFSGKPCHYFDGKLWKPLDTKLLTIGTEYGAPGCKPRIKTDGTVRIDGTDYSQRSTRIGIFNPTTKKFSAIKTIPLGNLDGDKMVAESGVWRRELCLTETGITEEIIIASKPTNTGATLSDWLVLETAVSGVSFPDGWLNDYEVSEFKFPPPSAHDSSDELSETHYADCKRYARNVNGVQYIYTGVSAVWLNSAVYPVTIDPDFGSGSNDTCINSAYPTRNFGVSTGTGAGVKTMLRFILSSVAAAATATATTLKLYQFTAPGSLRARVADVYKILDANGDWVEGTKNNADAGAGESCWNAKEADGSGGVTTAWAGSAGLSTADTDYLSTALAPQITTERSNDQYTEYTFTFNATGLGVMQDWFGDASNNGLLVPETGAVGFCLSDHATESYRPVLTVTYTTGGSKHFLSLLGVGK